MDDAALTSAIGLTDFLKAALGKLFEEEIAFTPGMKDRQKVLRLITNRAGISFRDLLRASSLTKKQLEPALENPPSAVYARLAQVRPAASKRMAVAMITTTARITTTANSTDFLTEGLNSCASMRTSIVLRHGNVDGVHRIALGVSRCPALPSGQRRKGGQSDWRR